MLDSLKADKTRAGGKDEAPASGPANTGTPGKRTPSERARLAALARWGKYKGKGKQKKGGKPKTTAEQKEAARRQKAAENRTATFSELGMFEDATAALEGLAAGKPVEDDGGLVKMGLAERGKDGTLRLTTAGKQVYNAAGRGDVGAAKDAMSRGRDKAPTGADGKPLPPGVSVGTADAETTARLKDKAAAAEEKPTGGGGGGGGKPKPTEDEKRAEQARQRAQTADATAQAVGLDNVDALRQARDAGGVDDPALQRLGLVGADGLATDQGRRALTALENGNVGQYRAALQDAAARIEREAAAQAREIEQAADRAERDAERERRIRQDERRRLLRELGETQKGIDMSDYAGVLERLIDIADMLEPDATKAGRRNSASDQALINAIHEAAEAICDLAMSLGAEGDEADEDDGEMEPMDDGAVKMLGEDRVGGYAVRFGGPDEPDLSPFRDYFTKTTDFWLDAWQTRPMLYHHAQDEATKDAPVVGLWTSARVDDVGVWVEGQLSAAHRYAGAIKELVKRGVLKLSSDSAPHLVVRERQANGTHEIKRWPLLAASLTPTPAEPRLLPVGALKAAFDAAGLLPPAELIDDSPEADASDPVEVAPDATKTAADERARRLRIELTLLEMEAA